MKQSRTWAVGILILTLLSAPLPLAASDSDTLTVSITITPIDTVVALGDSLDFEGFVTNHTADTLRVDVWFTVTPDSGNEVLVPAVALCLPNNPQAVTLQPHQTLGGDCWLWVPAWQNPGGYTLTGKVGDYVNIDSLVVDEDSFHFWVVD